MTNDVAGTYLRKIETLLQDIAESRKFYDNVGISVDILDGQFIYGITVGGCLEEEFVDIIDLYFGLEAFVADKIDSEPTGVTKQRDWVDSQSI